MKGDSRRGRRGAEPPGRRRDMGSQLSGTPDQGGAIHDLAGLVALHDVQECLDKIVQIQEKSLGRFTVPERLQVSRALSEVRRKLDMLLMEASPEWKDWT